MAEKTTTGVRVRPPSQGEPWQLHRLPGRWRLPRSHLGATVFSIPPALPQGDTDFSPLRGGVQLPFPGTWPIFVTAPQ